MSVGIPQESIKAIERVMSYCLTTRERQLLMELIHLEFELSCALI